jgi:hypothetical protein
MNRSVTSVVIAASVALATPSIARQDAATPEQRVSSLKLSLQENQKRLRAYEWIETTIVSLKGEEKSRKQQRCYYGADGKVQKVPIGQAPAAKPEQPSGRRGGRLKAKVIENKTEDMQEYMEQAAALIHRYVPPSPELIQKAKDAGTMSVKPIDQGRVRLEFAGYLQAADRFVVDLNAAANSLAAITVATYLEKPEDQVNLDVRFSPLPDGTNFPAQATLDARAKNITVVIQNSGHRPLVK